MTRRFFIKLLTTIGLGFLFPKKIKAEPLVDADFQMIVLTDSQCVDYNVFKRVADTAVRHFPDSSIVTVIGDLVDNGEADYQWRAWRSAAKKLLLDRIFLPVMGNHECYNHDWLNYIPIHYLKQFDFPDNGTPFNGYFYTYDYHNVHFLIVNTQFYELEDLMPDLFEAQLEWLRNDKTDLSWKVVLMHKDIYDYGQDKLDYVGEQFMDLFDELDVDLVLTGHLHTYRRRKRFKHHKPLYILCGLSGDQRYIEPERDIDEVSATPTDNYMVLESTANALKLRCYDIDSNLLDDVEILK
ncbi:MAG: metallophosphoesterase [Selenomonadaceae bacterium]|nr:metallophosphoesterase [Selenomonadaceae bacterium]MBR1859948.1 metallophosphoesterase [Selenomonadaceae bacterium]